MNLCVLVKAPDLTVLESDSLFFLGTDISGSKSTNFQAGLRNGMSARKGDFRTEIAQCTIRSISFMVSREQFILN